jgi:hypothetical protein
VEIDSGASSGAQGKYSFPWPALEAALLVLNVILFVTFLKERLIKTKETAISTES